MDESIVLKVALIGVLGIGSQWLAWRLQLPAIVLMAVAGVMAGPVLGILSPVEDFGDLLRPMVAVAVAIILFEGGLNLNIHELRGVSKAVWRLVIVGVPVGWLLGSFAAHYVAGLSWPVAVLFAGILVVTGPTVIIPLLRQAKLATRPAAILKWEGIVNDPIGALLAVFVFETISVALTGRTVAEAAGWLLVSSVLAVGLGFVGGRAIAWLFHHGLVPEFLKAAVILCFVLACFEGANLLQHETGLVAVTALGMTLANARIASIEEMRRFKENITIILVSALFVVLTASLQPQVLAAFDWPLIAFVAAVLLLVRPATVWISTIGSGLTWRERTLVGWIAPRGIVAVAVAGFFGPAMVDLGYQDAALLVPLTFAIVFVTVIAHGFSIGWLARRFGLSATGKPGVLLVGASPWSIGLAKALEEVEVPVTVADTNWHHLREARLAGLPVYYGEILAEATEYRLDLNRFGYLLALGDNNAYNALVCTQLAPETGRHRVFQLHPQEGDEDDPRNLPFTIRGRTLLQSGAGYDDLMERLGNGWIFQKTRLTEEYDLDRYLADRPEGAEMLFVVRPSGEIGFNTENGRPKANAEDFVVSFAPGDANRKVAERSKPSLPG
jgi:NhaP-type Na+/H+ or K+/H+ antiporter